MIIITVIEKSTLMFIWKHKRPWVAKATLRKKSKAICIKIHNFKLFYRNIAIKTACYWHKNRYENQWDRIEETEINLHSYTPLIFDKGAKTIWWRKDSLFNQWC
jgi:hypothetical protein